jgi:hypothetical protein
MSKLSRFVLPALLLLSVQLVASCGDRAERMDNSSAGQNGLKDLPPDQQATLQEKLAKINAK